MISLSIMVFGFYPSFLLLIPYYCGIIEWNIIKLYWDLWGILSIVLGSIAIPLIFLYDKLNKKEQV